MSADVEEPLVDLTERIPLRSKKTDRLQRKQQKKKSRPPTTHATLLDLPTELLSHILSFARPSDAINLSAASKPLRYFIHEHEGSIAKDIIRNRYTTLAKCFPLPILLSAVDPAVHPVLLSSKRQELLNIHKKPYQHVQPPDPLQICSCLTCVLAWNNLCLIMDLEHWQDHLDRSEPIPIIDRGKNPEWNQKLNADNASHVERALTSPLWYALVLQTHLSTTVRSVKRYHGIRSNSPARKRRPPFHMNLVDAASGTDLWLERSGPPSYEFPYRRDCYYSLEVYVPNRRWDKEEERWLYQPASQHERDVQWVLEHAVRMRARELQQEQSLTKEYK